MEKTEVKEVKVLKRIFHLLNKTGDGYILLKSVMEIIVISLVLFSVMFYFRIVYERGHRVFDIMMEYIAYFEKEK